MGRTAAFRTGSSYTLMFGVMFGDTGHGAILALAGAGAVLRGRPPMARNVGVLLLWAGLSRAAFSAASIRL